jgi:hypothetical protein
VFALELKLNVTHLVSRGESTSLWALVCSVNLILSLDLIHSSPSPLHRYLIKEDIPDNWNWDNVDGKSYLTKHLNQHIPHYCGS